MAGASREQALSLLSAAKNHGDLAVKLSSLRQAREILLSMEPSFAAEFFPYLVELHSSPESLVRKILLELAEELGLKVMEHSSVFMPVFLTLLKDDASFVVRQSIVSGTNFFCNVLEEMTLQFHQSGKVERWLEELWIWMIKFKDAICGIALEPGPVGTKLLAIKFLEMYVLLFTSDADDSETSVKEVKGRNFNISWVVGGHPILDPALLTLEANRSLGLLLDLLRSARTLSGSVTITVINCMVIMTIDLAIQDISTFTTILGSYNMLFGLCYHYDVCIYLTDTSNYLQNDRSLNFLSIHVLLHCLPNFTILKVSRDFWSLVTGSSSTASYGIIRHADQLSCVEFSSMVIPIGCVLGIAAASMAQIMGDNRARQYKTAP